VVILGRAKTVTASAETIGGVRARRNRASRVSARRPRVVQIQAEIDRDRRIVDGDTYATTDTTNDEGRDAIPRGSGQI
jgi:hypothetical protein